jgi:hypothetical protein
MLEMVRALSSAFPILISFAQVCKSVSVNSSTPYSSILTQVTPVTKPPAAKKNATTRAVSDGGQAVRIAELTTVVHS